MRDLNRAIQRHLQARLQPHGVAPGAWYFLRVLWEEGEFPRYGFAGTAFVMNAAVCEARLDILATRRER